MLGKVLENLPHSKDKNLLVGFNHADDAGVYKISEDMALIQTVDFFTPIVDDPYIYGQISAANSLSDVYAMGGRPLTAMNVVAYSPDIFPPDVLVNILRGGHDKVQEAGAVTVGGHTATDDELKYGLAVTGLCHPDKIITNDAARPGDILVLTKPLGTGIITTALKAGRDLGDLTEPVCSIMAELNKEASEAMQVVGVNACTDITGFGLLGHAYELARASGVGLRLNSRGIPHFVEAVGLIRENYIPGGTRANGVFLEELVAFDAQIPEELKTIMFDAQTSGGLLISVSKNKLDRLLEELKRRKVETRAVIGEVSANHPGKIKVY